MTDLDAHVPCPLCDGTFNYENDSGPSDDVFSEWYECDKCGCRVNDLTLARSYALRSAGLTRQVIEVDGERFGVPPHLAKRIVDALTQEGEPVGDGMLPVELAPHATEWYTFCERRFAVDRITISGQLAEAIVAALARLTTAPQQLAVALPRSYTGSTMQTIAGGAPSVTFHFDDAIEAENWHTTITAALSAPQDGEALTGSYVQRVPDKCDRIIWRGSYYHLDSLSAPQDGWKPIESAPKDGCDMLLSGGGKTFIGCFSVDTWFDTHSYERTPTHWMPLPPAPRGEGGV